jgi:hypothetical protein
MVRIYLREHSTHNAGYSFDKYFDLDNYSNSDELIIDLMEHTKEMINENNLDIKNFNLEEWLITDFELDTEYLTTYDISFDQYMSLDTLLLLNKLLNEDEDNDFKLKYLLENYKLHVALRELENADLAYIELENNSFQSENYILGEYFVDYSEDFGLNIPESIKYYIDYEKYGRDLAMDFTVYSFSNGKIVAFY